MLKYIDLPEPYLKSLCQLLATHVPTAEVWAYGSRVCGGGHETSDLDIVLRNPEQLDQPIDGRGALIEALQDSVIPILVDVHDWAYLPESFYREIERCHQTIQKPHQLS